MKKLKFKPLLLFLSIVSFLVSCQEDLDSSPILTPVETGLLNRTFFHENKQLEYALYIPTSYTGNEEVPLVVYLHGAPENKELAQSSTDFIDVSESQGFIMLYPEAGHAGSGGFIWAEGRGGIADARSDVSYINALVDAVSEELKIDPSKRYLCGFSNGGFMVQNVANQDNSRFAAMATVSASLHETFANTSPNPISMLYIYGTDDPITNYENGGLPPTAFNVDGWTVPALAIESAVDFWVGINGCNTTPKETDLADSDSGDNSTVTVLEYSNGTGGTEVKFYRINGGGHTWPGLPINNRPTALFEDTNKDIKAGKEIWEFFKKFERN